MPGENGSMQQQQQQNGDSDQHHLSGGQTLVGGAAHGSSAHGTMEYLRGGRGDARETETIAAGMVTSFPRRGSLDVSTASILSRLCEPRKQPDDLFVGPELHAAATAVNCERQIMDVDAAQAQRPRFSFVQDGGSGEPRPHIAHKQRDPCSSNAMPPVVTSPFQNTCDNAVFNVTSSSILYTRGMSSNSFLDAAPKEHLLAANTYHGNGLGGMAQEMMAKPAGNNPSRGKVLQAQKREAAFTIAHSDHNNHHQQHLQDRSGSPFRGHNSKSPSSPLGGAVAARRLPSELPARPRLHPHHEFDCSTHVTYSGELYHPIPSVSPVKDSLKEFEGGKRLRQTPPTSQSPGLFNDLESVLSEDFAFHSALANSVENVPAKTPEKLLASVPPSVIMNGKKSPVGFESFTDFAKDPGAGVTDSNGTMNNGSSSFVVSCQENTGML
jgi:hypothetical protein